MTPDRSLLGELNSAAFSSLVGSTPLVELRRLSPSVGTHVHLKFEGANPGGSIKDRVALTIMRLAIQDGKVTPATTVIESSSGNMGIALAHICSVLGLRFVCVVDPRITATNLSLLTASGADVVCVDRPDPTTGEYLPVRLRMVRKLLRSEPQSFWPDQYNNSAVPRAHISGTLPEIFAAFAAQPTFLFAAASTGGTVLGCQRYLQARSLSTRLVAVDALGSYVFGPPMPGCRTLPGLGASFATSLARQVREVPIAYVSDADCRSGAALLRDTEGLLVGASGGGVITAIRKAVMTGLVGPQDHCVALAADRGDRYGDVLFGSSERTDLEGVTRC